MVVGDVNVFVGILGEITELFEMPINKIMRKLFEKQEFENMILKFINDDHIKKQYG